MNALVDVLNSSTSSKKFVKGYFNYLNYVLNNISENEVASFIEILFQARERESAIFFLGNGGSGNRKPFC